MQYDLESLAKIVVAGGDVAYRITTDPRFVKYLEQALTRDPEILLADLEHLKTIKSASITIVGENDLLLSYICAMMEEILYRQERSSCHKNPANLVSSISLYAEAERCDEAYRLLKELETHNPENTRIVTELRAFIESREA